MVVQPPPTSPGTAQPEPIIIGVVNLVADDPPYLGRNKTVMLSIPEGAFRLSIDNPNELKNFSNKAVAQLPLEDVKKPLELTQQANGTWEGASPMAHREGDFQVRLEPVE